MGALGTSPSCTYSTCWQGEAALSNMRKWTGGGICQARTPLSFLNGSCSILNVVSFNKWVSTRKQDANGDLLSSSPPPSGVSDNSWIPGACPISNSSRYFLSQAWRDFVFSATEQLIHSESRAMVVSHDLHTQPLIGSSFHVLGVLAGMPSLEYGATGST